MEMKTHMTHTVATHGADTKTLRAKVLMTFRTFHEGTLIRTSRYPERNSCFHIVSGLFFSFCQSFDFELLGKSA